MTTRVGDRVIPTGAVIAFGRFRPEGPAGYQAQPPFAASDAPVRLTRLEALEDIVRHLTDSVDNLQARLDQLTEEAS